MDYNAIAKKYGAISSTAPSTAPSVPKKDYTALAQQFGGNTVAPTAPASTPPAQEEGSAVGNFLKGIVSAPATLIARPFQAAQSAGQLAGSDIEGLSKASGANQEAIVNLIKIRNNLKAQGNDTAHWDDAIKRITAEPDYASQAIKQAVDWQPTSGGIVAAAPQTASDVVKDVGRGIQTVALGTGAPLAGGAAFGFGSSLEQQGSDALLTGGGITNTLVSTLAGMGLGKALDLVGKPLINATGKVIGTITPKTLQDVASKGAGAVTNFMKHHEILPAGLKAEVAKIPQAAERFDAGINNLFKGTGNAVTSAVQSQYPGMTKDNIAKHYEKVEVDRLMEPTKMSGATFRNATEVSNDATKRGIDLKKLAADNKIYASDHIVDGKFATQETVDALRDEAMSGGKEILRPALEAAAPGVERVPISEVRNQLLTRLSKVPASKLSPAQKLAAARKIATEYADNSVAAASHPNGYNLTDLYDTKLQTSSGLYKGPKNGGVQTISDNLTSQQKQMESQVFGDLLKSRAPKELGIEAYMKAQEGRFILADYLQSLNTKKAPQSLFQRGVKRAAQLGGATTGASVAGPFGMFSGYQFGGIMADTFTNVSNPVKIAFLKSIGKTEPEIYNIMRQFTSDAKIRVELNRNALPSGGHTGKTSPELMKTQNKYGAVEMPGATPVEAGPGDRFLNNMNQNSRTLNNTYQLPAPSPRMITPNTQGTPNRISTLYGRGGDKGEVGGMRQRIKPRK